MPKAPALNSKWRNRCQRATKFKGANRNERAVAAGRAPGRDGRARGVRRAAAERVEGGSGGDGRRAAGGAGEGQAQTGKSTRWMVGCAPCHLSAVSRRSTCLRFGSKIAGWGRWRRAMSVARAIESSHQIYIRIGIEWVDRLQALGQCLSLGHMDLQYAIGAAGMGQSEKWYWTVKWSDRSSGDGSISKVLLDVKWSAGMTT